MIALCCSSSRLSIHDEAAGSASVHPREWAGERRSSNRPCLDIAKAFAEPCWGLQRIFASHFFFTYLAGFSPGSFDRTCSMVSIMPQIASGRE